MLLLLCCSVTEEDIPANEQVADDYLTSTVNEENDDNDEIDIGGSSTGKRRTVRYTADLEDAHADKLEQMQAFDAFRYGYRPLTNRNLNINTSLY